MALLRNLILLAVFCLPAFSFAETIPATPATGENVQLWRACGASCTGYTAPDALTACKYRGANNWLGQCTGSDANGCHSYNCNGTGGFATRSGGPVQYTCPEGQNWTLSGSTCTRPDCAAGETRQADGTCLNPCQSRSEQPPVLSWFKSTVGGPTLEGGGYCDGGCSVALNPSATGTSYNNGKEKIQRYEVVVLPTSCTEGKAVPTAGATPPPEPPKQPVCLPTEGVLTSTSGKVYCVPPGVETQSVPIVRKESTTANYPDGSTKTTETTYTKDPVSQVQDTRQTITSTPASGGGAGIAGTPGTTSTSGSTGTTSGTDPTADSQTLCGQNPSLQICKGGMNEEATQKQVLDALKPTEPADKSALDAAIADKAAEDAHKAKFDDIGALGQSDANGWFAWAMIPEVPSGSCSPMTGQFMGRTIEFDWCDELEKVRSIAGYAFYILTAFALFSIFTGAFGRKA